MSTYAIIGASRGIGLEFVRQLAARPGTTVFATVRSMGSATHLLATAKTLTNVHIIEADIADFSAVERAAKRVSDITGGTLDCLIHNAARMDPSTLMSGFNDYPSSNALDEDLIETFRINTLGVIHTIQAFLPLLCASLAPLKKIVVISSGLGDPKMSLVLEQDGAVAYGATKAASLVVAAKWAILLKKDAIAVASLEPGLVDTWETRGETGSIEASAHLAQMVDGWKIHQGIELKVLTPVQSVETQLKVIDGLTMEKTGMFFRNTGEEWRT